MTGDQDIDFDRIVHDPDYRRRMIERLKTEDGKPPLSNPKTLETKSSDTAD